MYTNERHEDKAKQTRSGCAQQTVYFNAFSSPHPQFQFQFHTFPSLLAYTGLARGTSWSSIRGCLFTSRFPNRHHGNCVVTTALDRMAADQAMHSWASRLNTFQIAHQLSKRRASSQQSKKKGAGNTVEWPHEHPSAEEVCITLLCCDLQLLMLVVSSPAPASSTGLPSTVSTMSNASCAR